jgi:hypothetical protein
MRKFALQAKKTLAKPLPTINYRFHDDLKNRAKITTDRFKELDSSNNAESLQIGDY